LAVAALLITTPLGEGMIVMLSAVTWAKIGIHIMMVSPSTELEIATV